MIRLSVAMEIETPAAALREAFEERVLPDALRALGAKWHSEYLPLHFQPLAYGKYGIARAPNKLRSGRRRPMVETGALERQVTSSARLDLTPTGLAVRMKGGRSLNFSTPATIAEGYPDFRAEITATTPEEADRFARFLAEEVEHGLDAVRRPERVQAG